MSETTCDTGCDCAKSCDEPTPKMSRVEAIMTSKRFRMDLDGILQRMKFFALNLRNAPEGELDDLTEVLANNKISQRLVEDAIMRQGMVLKSIGASNPYPQSYNPESPVVEPTADVKL